MLPFYLGLLAVLILFGLTLADMERNRRQLAELLDEMEPLVDRSRRLHLRNLRGLNATLFYAYDLAERLENEVHQLEKQRGASPPDGSRFSLLPGRRLRDLQRRISALSAGAATATPAGTATPAPEPAAPLEDDVGGAPRDPESPDA